MRYWTSLLRHTTLLFLVLAVGLALLLFMVKHQVRDLEAELTGLHRAGQEERQALHVLRAEWSYLTDAERLRRLAERHLDLQPLTPAQVGTFETLTAAAQPDDAAVTAAAGRVTR